MNKRAEHLATLGLPPDASWDEVTQAYKDMMRVWHPDRFQSDERLKSKAELQSQRINNAMSELRKMGKEPPAPEATDQDASQTRPTNRSSNQHQRPAQEQRDQSRSQRSTGSSSFLIAPLYTRQRISSTLIRIAFAGAILYAAYDSLKNAAGSSTQRTAALVFAFMALDLGARNLVLILLPKPVASVERNGLFFMKTGHLGWADIEGAWPVITRRTQALNLMLSDHYLSKRGILLRALMKFRRWIKTPHVTIHFNGLSNDPISFINAMKLRQIHHDISIEELPLPASKAITISLLIAVAAVCVALTRCYFGFSYRALDFLPYLAIFTAARVAGVTFRIFRS